MKKHTKWLAPIATLSIAGLLVAGCGTTSNSQGNSANGNVSQSKPVDGGTLTVSTFSDIVSVNPAYIQDTSSGDAASFIFANLYDYDRSGKVVVAPWSLAAEPMQISNGGKTYTIKLKKEAKWNDGQPVNADDVVFTFNAIRNPAYASPGITAFDKVQDVKKIDDQTVQVDLKKVYAPFQYALVTNLLPYHVLKNVPAKDLQNNAYGKDPAHTVSNGPWKWTEWKQKQYLTFEKDPNYWGPKPHIDKIVYKIYADQNTEVQALIKGDVDLNEGLPVTQLSAVKARKGLNVISEPGPQYEFLGMNFDSKNFPDGFDPFTAGTAKTRQAIAFALDRQGMVDNVLKGTGKLINSPFLPGSWTGANDAAVNYNFDPNKAKQLLAEDGWKPGADGILTKNGHRFSFELQYNAGNSRRQQVATIIQQNLKDVGIEVKPKALDFSSWVDQNLNPGKFPAELMAWQMNNPDPDQEATFSSKFTPPNGQDNVWYKNPTLDELWVKGYSTTDPAQRSDIYKQAAKEISTDLPYVFMYQYGTPEALSAKVHFGDTDKPEMTLPYGYFFHIQNWWIQ